MLWGKCFYLLESFGSNQNILSDQTDDKTFLTMIMPYFFLML